MLDNNKINKKDLRLVSESNLRQITEEVFLKIGFSKQDSELATDVLISADLRGVESHGVSNMLRKYIRDHRSGKLNPKPKWHIIRETSSVASMDCDSGLGLVIVPQAMEIAIKKAKITGVGVVTMKNGGHAGMLAYYAMQAIEHNMIGFAMTSTSPIVVPTFGAEQRLGTNPIALAAPSAKEEPFVYDAATSVVSSNKIGLAERLGIELEEGWIADRQGMPVMKKVGPDLSEYRSGRHPNILPLGSVPERGSHKGYGLAGVVEILSGILTGGGHSMMKAREGYSHCVMAYNIESFMDTDEFIQTLDDWLKTLKSTRPAPNQERVLYPGLQEAECEKDRRLNGIPLHKEVIEWFRATCSDLSITFNL